VIDSSTRNSYNQKNLTRNYYEHFLTCWFAEWKQDRTAAHSKRVREIEIYPYPIKGR